MDNPCKAPIDEKRYKYPRIAETNITNGTAKSEVKNVDCPKKGFFGLGQSGENGPPSPEVLVSKFLMRCVFIIRLTIINVFC